MHVDFDAETEERYGYINRALPAEKLTTFVEELAFRIATFQPEAIAVAKAQDQQGVLDVLEEHLSAFRNGQTISERAP